MKTLLPLISLQLICLYCFTDLPIDIPYYMDLYKNFTEFGSQGRFKMKFNTITIEVSNYKAIRTSISPKSKRDGFIFSLVTYSYIFDIVLSDKTNLSIDRKNCLATHTFQSIIFDLQKDQTFKASFKYEKDCAIFMHNLSQMRLLDEVNSKNSKEFICHSLIQHIIDTIKKQTLIVPLNKDATYFKSFLRKLEETTDYASREYDYKLNATHSLIDMSYNNITYKNQVEVLGDKSRFNEVKVLFSYTVSIDGSKTCDQEKGEVIFDHIFFGEKTFSFSNQFVGRRELFNFIQQEMMQFYLISDYK